MHLVDCDMVPPSRIGETFTLTEDDIQPMVFPAAFLLRYGRKREMCLEAVRFLLWAGESLSGKGVVALIRARYGVEVSERTAYRAINRHMGRSQ